MLRYPTKMAVFAAAGLATAFLATACGAGSTTGTTMGSQSGTDSRGAASVPAVGVPKSTVAGPPVGAPAVAQAGPGIPITEGPRVIRTGEVTLEVKKGAFDNSYQSALSAITSLGGYLQSAQAQAQPDQSHLQGGTFTFAVPSDKFQQAVESLRNIGAERAIRVSGQDVSLQYVDLQARLGNLEAQRGAMIALLQKAVSVQDIITIQGQLGNITGQIEQLKGQIAYFDKATSLSTLTVTIREGIAAVAVASPDPWGVKAAFSDGLHGFVGTLDAAIVAFGYVAPFLILAGFGLIAWRLRRRFAL